MSKDSKLNKLKNTFEPYSLDRFRQRFSLINKLPSIPENTVAMNTFGSQSSLPNSSQSTTMNDLLNALKIPDAIKTLPEFNGNSRLLFDFLNNVEEILAIIANAEDTPVYKLWLRAIRNKITGNANEVLDTYGTPLIWGDIKANLISHYSDKRNEMSLIGDLHRLKQTDTIENFYCKIIELLSNLNNQVNIHEINDAVKTSKQSLYHNLCLNIFVANIKDPIGSVVRARAPTTMKQAFEFCVVEQNIQYAKR